jgi:tetratricopeptide (TPR) repeat protein
MALDRKDLTGAPGALEEALTRGDSPRALAPLAEAQRLRGEIEEAIRTAEHGVAAFPDHVGIRIVHARTLSDAGRTGEARQAYREVLDRDPSNLEARAFLDEGETPGERAEAVTAAGSDELADKGRVGGLNEELADLADLFSERPRLDEGFDDRDPLSGIATVTLAEIYARQGLVDRAVEVCETVLERSPDNEQARARLEQYRRQLATTE